MDGVCSGCSRFAYMKSAAILGYLVNLPASFSLRSLVAALLLYNQKTNVRTCLGFVTVTKQTHLMAVVCLDATH